MGTVHSALLGFAYSMLTFPYALHVYDASLRGRGCRIWPFFFGAYVLRPIAVIALVLLVLFLVRA